MAFSLSPGVNVIETDLSTVIPVVSTTDGAFVGEFYWGPCEDVVLIGSEEELYKTFGKPKTANAQQWFTAAQFLSYGNKLRLVRAIKDSGVNTAKNAVKVSGSAALIKNDASFDLMSPLPGTGLSAARYAGNLGNGLIFSICPSAPGFYSDFTDNLGSGLGSGFTSSGTHLIAPLAPHAINLDNYLSAGTVVINLSTGESRSVVSVTDSSDAILDSGFSVDLLATDDIAIQWEFYEMFGLPPGTSVFAADKDGENDEIHAVVIDGLGNFSGTKGQLLEKYDFLSKITISKNDTGASNYWVEVINRRSRYIRILENQVDQNNVPATLKNSDPATIFASAVPTKEVLAGGSDGSDLREGDYIRGYSLFRNAEVIDVALVISPPMSVRSEHLSLATWIIQNVCEYRKDCIALISPHINSIVGIGDEDTIKESIIADREELQISSSYAVMDAQWKYIYDLYNDVYRWVPCCGDVAGLCVRTDTERDPWWSPAGLNRGRVNNVVKLAWNPVMSKRDDLYLRGINCIISIPDQGVVLYGDKTLLGKPSAFDRINVRRLFIVLEKAIALAARFMLFEFNDEFTRAQFVSLVDPYLRRVKASRGIYDYKVVCDETNNTPEVIDHNQFVGDIFIKPARSINFIQLNFICVRTGVSFEEAAGALAAGAATV